ncbi:MAG: sulfite exporter TauE/SafE family protein [Alphaproteobacteria bacterium]|nr:sulfite exporter TauE/SafE family protein [Alphaproteobacteria bacterium]
MQIYLPIAELSIDIFLILGLGAAVGFLSGMFGVGGGFLMTPLLIFTGVPPAVAVGTEANQIVASSVSGVLAHWRRGGVDFKMGGVLLIGGVLGSGFGMFVFQLLRGLGQAELLISLSYVLFLGAVGSLMLLESVRAITRQRKGTVRTPKRRHADLAHRLPFRVWFRKSKLYISVIPPIAIGFLVGTLSAIMGVGGGFIMVPAMIYILGMATSVVIGTSLFQIIFVTATVTMLHATTTYTVDVVLAVLLLIGGVIGAQIGARFGARLRGEQLRALLALMVLAVCLRLLYGLVAEPDSLYTVSTLIGREG